MTQFTLNPLVLPNGSSIQRAHVVPAKYRLDGFDQTYDFHTIAYDVIWMERQKSLLLICPKLLNLERLLTTSKITASGQVIKSIRIRRYRRHDEVWLSLPTRPEQISIELDQFTIRANVSNQETDFNNKNVLMTKSKDNDLVWVKDWMQHHNVAQSATAALIFDNGSTRYSLSELEQSMVSVPGFDVAGAVASSFPFGSWKASKLIHRSMFYQAGMLNIARHRFLHAARAVLPIDVDELVVGASMFDAAVHSRIGYVTIPGVWRYSNLPPEQRPRHSDHVWRRDPDAVSKEKYCLTPGRWFTDTVWDIHGLRRYMFNKLAMRDDARFVHCEHVSNGWKRKRDAAAGETLVRDPQTEQELATLRQM
ncbi:MAG: hypothetical protein WBC85_12500 [Planktotalea sp.]|uniref:hypothetical protein n=1 Tax=Planktotalea sp. TaxID=2029877 RepID=UPI003C78E5D7